MEFITLEYALVLAECRSYIAALADRSGYELSVGWERLLLLLDAIHGDDAPALEPVEGDLGEVWVQLVIAMDRLTGLRRAVPWEF